MNKTNQGGHMKTYTSYKYRSGAAALSSLKDGTIYFAPPEQLNDALEAKFDIASAAEFADVFNATLTELALARGFPNGLSFKRRVPRGLKAANDFENARLIRYVKHAGICATASRPDSQAMWAYYCDNHKGVCFHFEWPEYIIEKHELSSASVTYSEKARIHNRADDLRALMLELGKENPRWSMAQLEAFSMTEQFRRKWGSRTAARALSTKHADWKHEQEVRVLSRRAGALPILRDVLRSVIFTRTDFPEWGPIMVTLHEHYPNVRVADVSFDYKEPLTKSRTYGYRLVPIAA
jgi:hypothetical protein